jgi:hypothetical protein
LGDGLAEDHGPRRGVQRSLDGGARRRRRDRGPHRRARAAGLRERAHRRRTRTAGEGHCTAGRSAQRNRLQ